jgi:LacI family transcriptional regulator
MVTINDVAKKAQVSKATVSRYMNKIGFISEKLQDRISKAIDELDYEPNLIARSLKIQKTNTIGIIYPDIEDSFFSSIIKKIEEVSYDNGYSVILCNTEYDSEKEKVNLEVLKRKQVDGYIIFTTINDRNYLVNTLKNENVIFLDRSLDIEGEIFIKLDNIKSIKLAVDYLVSLGHKNIGIIMGPMKITTGIERLKGYKKALEEKNIELDKNLVKFAGSSIGIATQKTKELLTKNKIKPTALIASNTSTTIGILMAVRELKIKIPNEISIIGFGDLIYYSLIEPPLTVITQPLYKFGVLAAETLLGLLKGKKIKRKIIELEPKILVKDSCRRIDQL